MPEATQLETKPGGFAAPATPPASSPSASGELATTTATPASSATTTPDESAAAAPATDPAIAATPELDEAAAAPLTEAPQAAWEEYAAAIQSTFGNLIEAGGPVVLILLLLSIVALSIILLKCWQFAMLRIGARRRVEQALALWREQQAEAAIDKLHNDRQPVAQLVWLAMVSLRKPEVDPALVREELSRVAGVQLERLRSHLRALEIIATVSPLLGLLGTVLGMIEAFQQLATAGSQVDPAILSGGIWQALLTTAVGLSVAIPAVLAHSWLERKVERCGHFMEDAVTQVFTRSLHPIPLTRPTRSAAADESAVTHAA